MTGEAPEHLVVGHVRKPHGVGGELFVRPLTDHPERTFAPGVVLHLAGDQGQDPDPDLPPLEVEAVRPYREGVLVMFAGVEDRDQAALLRGRYLLRRLEEVEPVAEDELFYHELLGMRVEDREGAELGRVVEVYEARPADLLEVRRPGETFLIPFTRAVLVEIDREGRRLVVDPPEGLLDL